MKNLKKLDGSFNIVVNGMPYNTIQGDIYFKDTEKLYKKSPELFEIEQEAVIDIELLKTEKINQLKENCSDYIFSIYPQYKQTNILAQISKYNSKDLKDMKLFIEENINKCDIIEKQIWICTTKQELDLIITIFE